MTLPLITCIMPTANRREFVGKSIELFLAQDYPADRRELILIEDGQDNCFDLTAAASVGVLTTIAHQHLGYARKSIGEKRNLACELARGDLIAHWDDDDWHSPKRLSASVQAMLETDPPARLCGADRLVFLDDAHDAAYLYQCSVWPWLAGGTLVYEKALWAELGGFLPQSSGEDTLFVRAAATHRTAFAVLRDPSLYVAVIHGRNAEAKQRDPQWGGFDAHAVRDWMSA